MTYRNLLLAVTFIILGSVFGHTAPASAAVTKGVYRIDDRHSLYVIPFSLSHKTYTVVAPTKALRDTAASNTLTYTIKTAEGLRVKDGRSVAHIGTTADKGQSVLYVLYEKSASSSRANTLSVTALPFDLVSAAGTTTTSLRAHELRTFNVSDSRIKALEDLE